MEEIELTEAEVFADLKAAMGFDEEIWEYNPDLPPEQRPSGPWTARDLQRLLDISDQLVRDRANHAVENGTMEQGKIKDGRGHRILAWRLVSD